MMDALVMAEALCKRFEGLYLRPYLCPAGVPTIGYGATFYEDGRRVLLTWFGKIDAATYSLVTVATVGAYIAGNVVQKRGAA